MIRSLHTVFCCALTLAAFASFTATASATEYCVGEANADCNATFDFSAGGLDAAIDAYYGSDEENDTIHIAAGTIEFSYYVNVEESSDNGQLQIVGAGSGKTKLLFNQVGDEAFHFDASSGGISDLTIEQAGELLAERTGLMMHGGTAEDIYVLMAPGMNNEAIVLGGDTSCIRCRAKVSGLSATGFLVDTDEGGAYIEDSKAEVYDADPEVHTRGISLLQPWAEVQVVRTLLKGFNRGIFQAHGRVKIADSVIDLGEQEDAIGAQLATASTINYGYRTSLDGVTVVGSGSGQKGVELYTEAGGGGDIGVEVTNTLLWLTGGATQDYICTRDGGASIGYDFTVEYSLPASTPQTSDCYVDTADMVDGVPTFVDAPSGDYRPAPDSDVIDAGDPSSGDIGRFDFWGATRYINSQDFNFSGTIDIGAGEYQNYSPNKPNATATPGTVVVGQPVTFSATGSDPNNDPLTFSWEFGEGGSADGASVQRTYAVPGTYKAKAIASDGKKTHTSAWVEVTVVAPAPAPSIVLGKPTGKFKYKKKKPKPFALGTAASKVRIPVTTNFAGEVTLTLAKIKGGWTKGKKCVSKKPKKGKSKRCDLKLKGSQKLTLPAGESFLTFGGKWGRSALPTGKYRLTVTGGGATHDVAMNAVRNLR